jgi:serine/threonine-protein kinase
MSEPYLAAWQRLRPVLAALLERPRGEREAYLAGLPSDLAQEAREWLAADDEEASVQLEGAVAAGAAAVLASWGDEALVATAVGPAVPTGWGADGLVGAELGAWRLQRLLGRGGMAEVWEAARSDGQFEQTVAIKLLKRGMDSEEIVRRLLRERQILARLDHPAIARLFDGGVAPDGRPYLVLERIEGQPITEWCEDNALDVPARLRLLVACCGAVSAAHRQLVVHRDLKPSNILVTTTGQVKLLDFGIAKLLADDDPLSDATRAEVRVMTPTYAAPEQILGEPVTTATDVYALGVLAYELLAGTLPHRRKGRHAGDLVAALEGESIARPSTAVLEGAGEDGGLPTAERRERKRRSRELHGDLDAVVMTALRREPERRYAAVADLAADIERFLAGRPVAARPDSLGYRTRKFVGRHRAGIVAATLAVLSLVGGLVVALWQAQRAETAALRAQRSESAALRSAAAAAAEAARSQAVVGFLTDVFTAADPEGRAAADLTARELVERGVERIDEDLAQQPDTRAAMLHVLGTVQSQLGLYEPARELLEQAVALRRGLRPGVPRDLARSAASLGVLYHVQGRSADGVVLLEEARDLYTGIGDAAALDLAKTLNNLGNAYKALDRPAEARASFERAIAILDRTPGADPSQLARVLNNYGLFLDRIREPEPARRALERALALHERTSGPESALVSGTLGNLADLYVKLKDVDRAVAAAERARAIAEKTYGPDHYSTALAHNMVGWTLLAAERPQEAIAPLERGLAVFRGAVGERHRAVGYSYRNLGQALAATGRRAEAVAALRKAIEVWRATLGDDAPELGTVYVLLAPLLPVGGDGGEGERLLERTVELWREPGSQRQRLGDAWLELARARAARCRIAEAREALAAARTEAASHADMPWVEGLPEVERTVASASCPR